MIVALLLLAAPQGFIDEAPASEPVQVVEEDEPAAFELKNEKPWYQSLGVSGFLEAGFGAIWPEQTNTFFVGEVEADLHKKLLDVAALRIDVNLLNRLPWQPLGVGTAPSFATFGLAFDNLVEQAHGEWFPLGEAGPRVRLGKYNALIGYERQDPIDRLMVSQSLVFLHGTPANFTGIAIEVPLPVGFHLTLHGAINGWDRGLATSRNKSFGGQVKWEHTFKKNLVLTIAASALYGTERLANTSDYRLGTFMYVALEHAKSFWFAVEGTYGQEPGLPRGSVPGLGEGIGEMGMSRWYGFSAWIKGRVPRVSWLSLAARYDFFNDPARTRGLVQNAQDIADGGLTRRQQLTGNVTAVLTEGVSARLEYTADFLEGREPDRIRRLAVAHRLALQALLRF